MTIDIISLLLGIGIGFVIGFVAGVGGWLLVMPWLADANSPPDARDKP